jgi:Cys-rich repeat protein
VTAAGARRAAVGAILAAATVLAACHGDIRFAELTTCAADGDCLLASLHCASSRCVQCTSDAHCGPGAPRCDTTLNRCVGCLTTADCVGGDICKSGLCAPPCSGGCPANASKCDDGACVQCDDGLGCAGSPAGPYCVSHACATCRTDADCGAGTPRCDGVAHRCVQCELATDCPAATPLCDIARGTCVGVP